MSGFGWWEGPSLSERVLTLVAAARAAILRGDESDAVALAVAIGRRVSADAPVVVGGEIVW